MGGDFRCSRTIGKQEKINKHLKTEIRIFVLGFENGVWSRCDIGDTTKQYAKRK